ncbi:lipoprotein [Streptomyces rectiviolaceus]|uniref:Lipoprotein n=1 Tax=Streptomyces rectiviolaceus TaxID=332591 RepID=A0ABP6MAM7_9ACTN
MLLSGCSDSDPTDERPSAAARLRAQAARDSGELLGRYDAVLAAHPSLAGRLDPLRAEVKRHEAAFAEGSAPPSPSGSPSTSASPTHKPSVPKDEKDAVHALAKAERELAKQRGDALLDAPAELARLLASVAAAGAAHAYLLTEGDK